MLEPVPSGALTRPVWLPPRYSTLSAPLLFHLISACAPLRTLDQPCCFPWCCSQPECTCLLLSARDSGGSPAVSPDRVTARGERAFSYSLTASVNPSALETVKIGDSSFLEVGARGWMNSFFSCETCSLLFL